MDFDNKQAISEGWDLFDVDGRLQLQRIDCPEDYFEGSEQGPAKFASDADAIIFVAMRANEGSGYHRDALMLIGTLAEGNSDTEQNVTVVLQHSISWWVREKAGVKTPCELDDCSVEHIKKMIDEGYVQGELCILGDDGETEHRGWWSIAAA